MDPFNPNQPADPLPTQSAQPVQPAQPILPPESYAPFTPQQQPTQHPVKKPKIGWPLILSWIIFIAASLIFLAFGPGSFIAAAIMSPYTWIVSFWWVPFIHSILYYAGPVLLILAGLSLFFAYKKYPMKMITVLILLSNTLVGLPITWLGLSGVIKMKTIVYAVIAGVITLAPIVLLIVFKNRDKKNGITTPYNYDQKTAKTILIICLVIIVAELIGSFIHLATGILSYY